jgi:hypothetical protein
MHTINLGVCDSLATQLALEFMHRDRLRCCDTMVHALFGYDFVDGLDLVGELGDDDLLLNDGLDGLVEVVVDGGGWCSGLSRLGLVSLLVVSALEGSLVSSDLGLDLLALLVLVDSALFRCLDLSVLLYGLDITVLQRLDGGVVVVLVDLAVDDLLFSGLMLVLDVLVLDGRGDCLINGGVLLACSSSVNYWCCFLGLGVDLDLRSLDFLGSDSLSLNFLSLDLLCLNLLGLGLFGLGGLEVLTCTSAGLMLVWGSMDMSKRCTYRSLLIALAAPSMLIDLVVRVDLLLEKG